MSAWSGLPTRTGIESAAVVRSARRRMVDRPRRMVERRHRANQNIISLESLPFRMDDDTRQKLISLLLVFLMLSSGIAYTISLI